MPAMPVVIRLVCAAHARYAPLSAQAMATNVASAIIIGDGRWDYPRQRTNGHKSDADHQPFKFKETTMDIDANCLPVKFAERSALTPIEERALCPITDQATISRITNAIPDLAKLIGNAATTAAQAAGNGGMLYQAILPGGATLAASKGMEGAVRGFYNGAGGIAGHANFKAVGEGASAGMAMGVANAAFAVAAIVAGQYYLPQLNAKMTQINDKLNAIASFQHNEYLSKILRLLAKSQTYSQLQLEILDNEERCQAVRADLMNLEQDCMDLLGQANLTLRGFANNLDLEYEGYEYQVQDVEFWRQCQSELLAIMKTTTELTTIFNCDNGAQECSRANFNKYKRQAMEALGDLENWHDGMLKRLEIDLTGKKRREHGLKGIVWSHADLPEKTSALIAEQRDGRFALMELGEPADFREIRLVARAGELYYLPDTNFIDQTAQEILAAVAEKHAALSASPVNLLILGKTGIGKKTLAQAAFFDRHDDAAKQEAISADLTLMRKNDMPLGIYIWDLGAKVRHKADATMLETVSRRIAKGVNDQPPHAIWYCLDGCGDDIEHHERELLNALAEQGHKSNIPIILVLAKSFSKKKTDELRTKLKPEELGITQVVTALAKSYEIDYDLTKPAYGLETLMEMTDKALGEMLGMTLQMAQRGVVAAKAEHARRIVATAQESASMPISIANPASLSPSQFRMLMEISLLFPDTANLRLIPPFLAATIGSGAVMDDVMKDVISASPAAKDMLDPSVVGALTAALGEAYIAVLEGVATNRMTTDWLVCQEGQKAIKQLFRAAWQAKRPPH